MACNSHFLQPLSGNAVLKKCFVANFAYCGLAAISQTKHALLMAILITTARARNAAAEAAASILTFHSLAFGLHTLLEATRKSDVAIFLSSF